MSGKVGTAAGINEGTVKNLCVLETTVSGNSEIGGVTGYNKGAIEGCAVITGEAKIRAVNTVGGIAGYSEGNITDSEAAGDVAVSMPGNTDKISTTTIGRYVGGIVGYQEAAGTLHHLSSGVMVEEASGLPLVEDFAHKDGGESVTPIRVCSDVTGIRSVGGIVGEMKNGAGEFTDLYNYARLHVTYVDTQERTKRSDTASHIYLYFGGITGRVYAGNSLKNCENYAAVALDFRKNGEACDAAEIYNYQHIYPANSQHWNMPRHIGGIAGYNQGTVEDCVSLCGEYGTFEEEVEEYDKAISKDGICYVGGYVGGLIGYNEGTLRFTDSFSSTQGAVDSMQVVVRAFGFSNGGLVGYAKTGSILNEGGTLKIRGVVASLGMNNPQDQQPSESTGGVAGFIGGGEITGSYINESSVMGRNAGGITGYLGKNLTLTECSNTAVVYGRGMNQGGNGSVGGIVGRNHGTLTECTNTGSVLPF